jgi:hypothetical protein
MNGYNPHANSLIAASSEHMQPDLEGLEQPTIWSEGRFICGVKITVIYVFSQNLLGVLNFYLFLG